MSDGDKANFAAPVSGPADFFEVALASWLVPLHIGYSAIRDWRGEVNAVSGARQGLLLGARTREALSIQKLRGVAVPASDPESVQTAFDESLKAWSQDPGGDPPQLVGFFRMQAAGRPEARQSDLDIADQCLRQYWPVSGGLFLLIQTHVDRPWSAALFALDDAASVSRVPELEFPFDEYLSGTEIRPIWRQHRDQVPLRTFYRVCA